MIRLEGHYKTAIETSQILKDMGYVHGKDYTWTTNSEYHHVLFSFMDPQIETYMALKLGGKCV